MTKHIFLIGAAKCGTTKLADMLNRSESICLSEPKESNYFSPKVFASQTQDWYQSLFKDKNAEAWLDASTAYSAGWVSARSKIPEAISAYDSQSEIVYLVRDPVARAWSSYWHGVRMGVEKRTPKEALSDNQSHHIQASLYHERLTEYSKYFPISQIHVLTFEEFIRGPERVANALLKKLTLEGIDLRSEDNTKRVNESYQWSGAFSLLGKIPSPELQKINSGIKKVLPKKVHEQMKKAITKPIPNMPNDIRGIVQQQVSKDSSLFQAQFMSSES